MRSVDPLTSSVPLRAPRNPKFNGHGKMSFEFISFFSLVYIFVLKFINNSCSKHTFFLNFLFPNRNSRATNSSSETVSTSVYYNRGVMCCATNTEGQECTQLYDYGNCYSFSRKRKRKMFLTAGTFSNQSCKLDKAICFLFSFFKKENQE